MTLVKTWGLTFIANRDDVPFNIASSLRVNYLPHISIYIISYKTTQSAINKVVLPFTWCWSSSMVVKGQRAEAMVAFFFVFYFAHLLCIQQNPYIILWCNNGVHLPTYKYSMYVCIQKQLLCLTKWTDHRIMGNFEMNLNWKPTQHQSDIFY
jgi:hypothetical protein